MSSGHERASASSPASRRIDPTTSSLIGTETCTGVTTTASGRNATAARGSRTGRSTARRPRHGTPRDRAETPFVIAPPLPEIAPRPPAPRRRPSRAHVVRRGHSLSGINAPASAVPSVRANRRSEAVAGHEAAGEGDRCRRDGGTLREGTRCVAPPRNAPPGGSAAPKTRQSRLLLRHAAEPRDEPEGRSSVWRLTF